MFRGVAIPRQADALAYGKTPEQLRAEGVPEKYVPHRTVTGNRPSLSILLPELNAYTVGQLLAMYEHRVAVQVCWTCNSGHASCVLCCGSLQTKILSILLPKLNAYMVGLLPAMYEHRVALPMRLSCPRGVAVKHIATLC